MSLSSDVKIINPVNYKGWNDKVIEFDKYSVFHSAHWAKILSDTYGYIPCYFVIESNGTFLAVVPMMIVNSYLTGKRLVSLPFTDFCRPLLRENIDFNSLYDEIIKFGFNIKAKYIQIKDEQQYFVNLKPLDFQYGHKLCLPKEEDGLFSSFRKGNKSTIKKAIKEGITVKIDTSQKSVEEFCKMNFVTRKKHGLPPQPVSFFRNLYDNILAENLGFVSLAERNGEIIAGAIYLTFGSKVEYKYSASYPQFSQLGANNLIMWEVIKYCMERQYGELNFGITESSNEGLRIYKNGWGTDESIINLFKFNLKENVYEPFDRKLQGFHNKIFNRAPIPLLKVFSSVFYKHFG